VWPDCNSRLEDRASAAGFQPPDVFRTRLYSADVVDDGLDRVRRHCRLFVHHRHHRPVGGCWKATGGTQGVNPRVKLTLGLGGARERREAFASEHVIC